MDKKRGKGAGPADGEFEEFDVAAEGPGGFESFDVVAEATAAEPLDALLGGIEGGETDLRALAQAHDELTDRLLVPPGEKAQAAEEGGTAGLENVVGLGLGEKAVDGVPTGRLAIKVFVKEKLNPEEVSAAALVPKTHGGIPTDVDATGEIYAYLFTGRRRPATGGISIGNCGAQMAGTLGCLVSRGTQLFVLSNNHVMALVNRGPVNVGIPQPGLLDGGSCPGDIIARLTQWTPIVFGGAANQVDAAIAQTSPQLVDPRMLRPGGVLQRLVSPEMAPAVNMTVQKSGRTTQYRRGIIDAVRVTLNVSYAPFGGVGRFVNQFRVRGILGQVFSDRGDSGSLVTTFPGNNPVGLLFAGNAATNFTFCNPIQTVMQALGTKIVY